MNSVESILGYPVTTSSKDECVNEIASWIRTGEQRKYFVCANPHSLEVARTDALFDEAIRNSDLIVPDGYGIVFASRLLGGQICDRVTGSDVFLALSEKLNAKGGFGYFFLGSTEENLARIAGRMKTDFPNIRIAGMFSPSFRDEFNEEENRAMIESVNAAAPDVLWIGMTAPKQEKWIHKNRERLNVKFIGAIGAVFDFYSGRVKRSHSFFQKSGLEWLPRFSREPRRLWRRNLISTPRFLFRVVKQKLRSTD